MDENSEKKYHEYDAEFELMKQTLQKILDKHLPANKKFSIESFDKEDVWYMCRLLLEKDDEKRNLIWKEMDKKRKDTMEEFLRDLKDLEKKKAEFDSFISTSDDLRGLSNNITLNKELEKEDLEKKKAESDNLISTSNDLSGLSNDITLNKEREKDMDNF